MRVYSTVILYADDLRCHTIQGTQIELAVAKGLTLTFREPQVSSEYTEMRIHEVF